MKRLLLVFATAAALGAATRAGAADEHRLETRFGAFRVFTDAGVTHVDGNLQGKRFSSVDRDAPAWFERVGVEQVEGRTALRFAGPGASYLLLVHDLPADALSEEQRKGWQELLPRMIERVDGHYRIPTAVLYGTLDGNALVGGFGERIPLK